MSETVTKTVEKLQHKTHWESNFRFINGSEIATKKSQTVLKVSLLFSTLSLGHLKIYQVSVQETQRWTSCHYPKLQGSTLYESLTVQFVQSDRENGKNSY
jgi:hypothetical protein